MSVVNSLLAPLESFSGKVVTSLVPWRVVIFVVSPSEVFSVLATDVVVL